MTPAEWEQRRKEILDRMYGQMEQRGALLNRIGAADKARADEAEFQRAAGAPVSAGMSGALIGGSFGGPAGAGIGAGIGYGLGAIGEYKARRKRGEGRLSSALGALNPFDETVESLPGLAGDPRTFALASSLKHAQPAGEDPRKLLTPVGPGNYEKPTDVGEEFTFGDDNLEDPSFGRRPQVGAGKYTFRRSGM